MITTSTCISTWTVAPSAVFCMLEDSAAILDAKCNTYFLLEGAAVPLWPLLEAGATLEQLTQAVIEQFEIDEATATEDLELWMACMRDAGLLVPHGPQAMLADH